LSLLLAIHKYKQNNILVLDEIDAALDIKYSDIVGRYVKQL
jgi:chromosome segregation ATPase